MKTTICFYEQIEQNRELLRGQAIAYLNVDLDIRGNYTFMAESSPLLYPTIWMVTKNVNDPHQDNLSNQTEKIFDSYYEATRFHITHGYPYIGLGNVKSPFLQLAGIPVIDYYYDCYESVRDYIDRRYQSESVKGQSDETFMVILLS